MHQPNPVDLLRTARFRYTQKEIAYLLDVDIRTVRRWEVRQNDPPGYLSDAIKQRLLSFVSSKIPLDSNFWFFRFLRTYSAILIENTDKIRVLKRVDVFFVKSASYL
jgi:DNA (cytosine-5)-methyltransferase 1